MATTSFFQTGLFAQHFFYFFQQHFGSFAGMFLSENSGNNGNTVDAAALELHDIIFIDAADGNHRNGNGFADCQQFLICQGLGIFFGILRRCSLRRFPELLRLFPQCLRKYPKSYRGRS